MKNPLKIIVFLFLFSILFYFIQRLFVPVWIYPEYWDQVDDVIKEFKKLPNNSVQVLFIGTSHVAYGVSPMELYESTGIVSYNLGTSNQGLDSSYMALREAYKTQSPKIVFLDVSKLDDFSYFTSDIKMLRDNIAFGKNKLNFILAEGNGYSISENINYLPQRMKDLLPFYEYHSRWSELSANSFKRDVKKQYFTMGYNIFSVIQSYNSLKSVEDDLVERITVRNVKKSCIYNDGIYNKIADDQNPLYDPHINEASIRYITAIKNICDEHGSELVLTKIPSIDFPQFYKGCWTKIKHNMVLQFADELGLKFFDLKYDVDCELDWSEDTVDSGRHLNLLGARRITKVYEQWILKNYKIKSDKDLSAINKKIPYYEDLSWLCELQLERDFSKYMSKLSTSNKNLAVFFSLADTELAETDETEKKVLLDYGFKTNFNDTNYADSFLGVVDNGVVRYECISNREQQYSYRIDDNFNVYMTSAGWECENISRIIINDKEYSMNRRGLNIVVFDKSTSIVLDSVCFDFYNSTNKSGQRNIVETNKSKFDYQYYLYEHPEVVK